MPNQPDRQTTTNGLQLGDRVRVNSTCTSAELIGDYGFVAGLTMRPNLTINVWLTDTWPPQWGGSDEWKPSELDKVRP